MTNSEIQKIKLNIFCENPGNENKTCTTTAADAIAD